LIFEIKKKQVFVSDSGNVYDSKKKTIILLHGSGLTHIVWSLTEQYLINRGYNVFSIDLPGHGSSNGPSLKTIEETATWLNALTDEIGVNKFTLIGHSQGCLIALEYTFKYSEKVENVIFLGGSYEIPVNQDLIDLALAGSIKSVNLMMKWGYGDPKRFIGGNPVQKIINSPREISEILAIDLIACNNYKNGLLAAKTIKCPSFFVLGELDKMIPLAKSNKFANLVPGSKVHVIKNCGHMIMFENAFEMREKVVEFLKK
jgi:pimeloyl-ACP methyl ester carboxylesterase